MREYHAVRRIQASSLIQTKIVFSFEATVKAFFNQIFIVSTIEINHKIVFFKYLQFICKRLHPNLS